MPNRIGFYCAKHEQFSESGACNYCEPVTALVVRSGCPTSLRVEMEHGPLTAEDLTALAGPTSILAENRFIRPGSERFQFDGGGNRYIAVAVDRGRGVVEFVDKKLALLNGWIQPTPKPHPLTAQEIREREQDEASAYVIGFDSGGEPVGPVQVSDKPIYFLSRLPPQMTAESVRGSMRDRIRNLFEMPMRRTFVETMKERSDAAVKRIAEQQNIDASSLRFMGAPVIPPKPRAPDMWVENVVDPFGRVVRIEREMVPGYHFATPTMTADKLAGVAFGYTMKWEAHPGDPERCDKCRAMPPRQT